MGLTVHQRFALFTTSRCSNILKVNVDFWIKTCYHHKSAYAIHSSSELAQKIKAIKPPINSSLISSDVPGLFPNLPHHPTLNHLRRKLEDAHVPDFIADELFTQLKLCLSPNFCRFNGKTISAFQWGPHWALRLVKFLWIFLKPLFSLWIRRFHPTSHTYWFRYMDDILCLWHGSATDLSLLFDVMNNMFPSIKFTIEHAEVNLSTFWTLLFLLLMESTSSTSTRRIHL